MNELFADDYPRNLDSASRNPSLRRCGMDPWIDIARAVGFVGLATILVVVYFRLRKGDDPPG